MKNNLSLYSLVRNVWVSLSCILKQTGGGELSVSLVKKPLQGELLSWQLVTSCFKSSRTVRVWQVPKWALVSFWVLGDGRGKDKRCIISANRRAMPHIYRSFKLDIHESCGPVILATWEKRDEGGNGGILH